MPQQRSKHTIAACNSTQIMAGPGERWRRPDDEREKGEEAAVSVEASVDETIRLKVSQHLKTGRWALLLFLSLGIVLETLNRFKIGAWLAIPPLRKHATPKI